MPVEKGKRILPLNYRLDSVNAQYWITKSNYILVRAISVRLTNIETNYKYHLKQFENNDKVARSELKRWTTRDAKD